MTADELTRFVAEANARVARTRDADELLRLRDAVLREGAQRFAIPVVEIWPALSDAFRTRGLALAPPRPAVYGRSAVWWWERLGSDDHRARAAALLRRRRYGRRAAPPRQPMSTVVVLSYRRPEALQRTLHSLRATTDPERTELIVVDNATAEPTQRVLLPALETGLISGLVLSEENLGVSSGYNLGFALADPASEYLTKVDHDQVLLSPGWLAEIADLLRHHPEIAIVSLDQVNHLSLQGLRTEMLDDRVVKSWSRWQCGSTMTVPRAIRDEKIGDFRETELKYFPDDVDYFTRARLSGMRGYYLVDHCSFHIPKAWQAAQIKKRQSLAQVGNEEADQMATWASMSRTFTDDYLSGKTPMFIKYDRYRALSWSRDRLLRLPAGALGSR